MELTRKLEARAQAWESLRSQVLTLVDTLFQSAEFKAGDRVKSLRGSTRGVIVRVKPDGRVVWRLDEYHSELIALPEDLLPA
jgi:hypothetical protein